MIAVISFIARKAGAILLSIGLIHVASGFFLYTDSMRGIMNAGIISTVDQQPEWFGVFWYEISGFFLVLYGLLAGNYITQHRKFLKPLHGYLLLLLSLTGILLEPMSGFYLFIPVAVCIILRGNTPISPKTFP